MMRSAVRDGPPYQFMTYPGVRRRIALPIHDAPGGPGRTALPVDDALRRSGTDCLTVDRPAALTHYLPWAKFTTRLMKSCPLGLLHRRYFSWLPPRYRSTAMSIARQRMAAHSTFLTNEPL